MAGWLSSYRVIDLTDERGLIAGQMLAKLGADVIQVEPPGGSPARRLAPFDTAGRSLFWSAYAGGKRGVTLDLEREADRVRLRALIATADFLIDSAPPGEMAARGLSFDALERLNPGLIGVSITPFGATGPKSGYQASDLVLWAAAGPLHPHRDTEGPPLGFSVPQAWLHAAADAAGAALVAHFAKVRTGLGQHIDVSAQQSLTPATLFCIAAAAVGHADYLENRRAVTLPIKWRASDGLVELLVPAGPMGMWTNNLFALMRAEAALPERFWGWDWVSLPERLEAGEVSEDDVLSAQKAIAAFVAARPRRALSEAAIAHKILLAPVNTIADLLESPHHRERSLFATVREGGREATLPWAFALGAPGMFAEPAPAPAIGEHNAEVLGALTEPRVARAAGGAEPTAAPFAGLKVLDLAWVVAGPAIGRVLADYGATVARLESSARIEVARVMGPFPGGVFDPQRSALYDNCNTGKLGMAIDLSSEAGRAIVRELAAWADVVIESFAPGQMQRWGLGPAALRSLNRGLVGVSTSLMGQSGPHAPLAGFGNIGAAMAGFQPLVGREGADPIGPFGPYTDYVGPRFALVALLAALDHRRLTGEGCWLDVSQAEAGIQFLAPQVAEAAATGRSAAAHGNRDQRYAPNGVFRCAGDDAWIALTARDDAEWARLAHLIGGGALATDLATLAGRKAHEDRLEFLIEDWTARRTAEEIEAELQGLGLPAHKAATSADMVGDAHLAARGHFVRLPHPLGGESVFEASRFALSRTPAAYRRVAPHFGRDTREILHGILGYEEAKIAALQAAGVLK